MVAGPLLAPLNPGLEDQLLGKLILKEKHELEEQRQALLEEVQSYKKKIKQLEDDLLFRSVRHRSGCGCIIHWARIGGEVAVPARWDGAAAEVCSPVPFAFPCHLADSATARATCWMTPS